MALYESPNGGVKRDLYGHGDIGALEEIDLAIGANVVSLREGSVA